MLSLGIDYHDAVWNVALWDEARAADLHAFRGAADVWDFLESVERSHPGLPVVLPSALGVPVTRARDLLDRDIAEMTLVTDAHGADGLAAFLAEARRRLPRAICIPAVKLLPSVPIHRKINRIDLGGSDALCAAVWVLYCLCEAGRRPLAGCSFLHAHCGARGRSLLALWEGRIIDGIGETAAGLGTPSPGAWRGLLRQGEAPRLRLQVGHAGADAARDASAAREALRKETYALLGAHHLTEVVLTGAARKAAGDALEDGFRQTILPAPADGYEAALGAAVVAAGLTGGPTTALADHLGLRETRERALDGLYP